MDLDHRSGGVTVGERRLQRVAGMRSMLLSASRQAGFLRTHRQRTRVSCGPTVSGYGFLPARLTRLAVPAGAHSGSSTGGRFDLGPLFLALVGPKRQV